MADSYGSSQIKCLEFVFDLVVRGKWEQRERWTIIFRGRTRRVAIVRV